MFTWATTLVNSHLPPMTPAPDWYEEIHSKLQSSKQYAETWLNNDMPSKIFASMTDPFIEYAEDFKTVAASLQPILDKIAAQNNIPTDEQVQDLTEAIGALQQETATNNATVQSEMKSLAAFKTQMQESLAALDTALKSALPAEAADRAAVQQVQTQIQSAEISLAALSQSATDATVDTENAMIGMVVGLAFSAGFDPVGFGIALLGIGVDFAIDAETEDRVISDLNQIEALNKQLSADQMQLGLMQGICSNLEQLSKGIESALTTFDDFDDTWSFANYGLTYLLVVLAQPQIDISKIPDLQDLSDAIDAWDQVKAFAEKTQNAVVSQLTPYTISSTN